MRELFRDSLCIAAPFAWLRQEVGLVRSGAAQFARWAIAADRPRDNTRRAYCRAAAGGGTQDANYAVPERTSPTS